MRTNLLMAGRAPALFFATFLLPALVLGGEALPLRSLDPPVRLPDGTEFKTWEPAKAPVFTRTYYVDGESAGASDSNPGTRKQPFKTIGRAAQILEPGERVVVAAGTYRERIAPARGGTGPDRMISYEAAPNASVILKGSQVFEEPWTADDSQAPVRVWTASLEVRYFEGYNPFAIDNVTPEQFERMDWATPLRGKVPYTLPRGLVFQDGRRLEQVAAREDVAARAGTYWVDREAQALVVRCFEDARPDGELMEITTRETVFAPEQRGLGFIRVKGFTVEQVGGPFPWEQVGAISTTCGHHWIIEANTIRQVNGVGMDVGVQVHPRRESGPVGHHIIRRNRVSECGIGGICGLGPGGDTIFGLLLEENVLRGNAFHDVERLFETGAIKTHCNVGCLIQRNLIVDTRHGAGIWMDWDNRNSRCTRNVIMGSRTIHGAIFLEASFIPNLIDQNVVWDTDGHGVYEHDSTGQVFAHNFVGRASGSGFHLHGRMTDRRIADREPAYGRHTARNNLLFACDKPDVFGGEPSVVEANLSRGITAELDPDTIRLLWSVDGAAVLSCPLLPFVDRDFHGRSRRGPATVPGPFGRLPGGRAQSVLWPFPL